MRALILVFISLLAAGPAVAYAQDTYHSQQWHLSSTKWTLACPLGCGAGHVIVAVIDTTFHYPHEDLDGRWWTNPDEVPGNAEDDDGNGFVDDVLGWDFVHNDSDAYDFVGSTKPAVMSGIGHGTLVAGVVGAIHGNGRGVAGMANVQLMPLQGTTPSGTQSPTSPIHVANAIRYAVDEGAHVISMSLHVDPSLWSSADMATLDAALAHAHNNNVVMVAAAGNNEVGTGTDSGCGLDRTRYPASDWRVIGVAGTNPDEKTSLLSWWGQEVDIAAPMEGIWSTYANGGYDFSAGTSYATPQVAAVAALVVEDHLGADGRLAIPALDVAEILRDSSDPIVRDAAHVCVGSSNSVLMPFGKLNAYNALQQSGTWS